MEKHKPLVVENAFPMAMYVSTTGSFQERPFCSEPSGITQLPAQSSPPHSLQKGKYSGPGLTLGPQETHR